MEASLAIQPITPSQWVQCLLVIAFVLWLLNMNKN